MMNTILVPVPCVNSPALSSSVKPANVTAHVPPTGVIRNGGTLLKTLENIWFIFNKEGYFCAGNDYLARKVKVAESTVGRALSRLQELGAVQIILYPGLLREIKPLVSVAELRTLMSGLLASFLRSVSPILLSPVSEIAEIAKLTNRNESVPVPSPVVGSLALQKEKDSEKTPNPKPGATMATDCRGVRAAKLSVEGTYFPKQNSNAKGVPAVTNESDTPRPQAVSVVNTARAKAQTPSLVRDVPLDLPAAAAQLVDTGKVAAKIVLRHIRRKGREVVDKACAAVIEYEQKKPVDCHEKALYCAVEDEWEPSTDFALPYNPGSVSVDYVKPSPDALAAEWPGASEKRLHVAESQFSSTEGRMVRCAGKHRALVMRMVNWIFREPQGKADDDAEWVAVARLVVAAGSYLHLPMDWEAPRMEGVTGN